jgi:cytoplasmic iron level regulating protein YaaA (DUF328/UPF0246 family)
MVKASPDFLTGNYEKNSNINAGPDFGEQALLGRYLPALRRYQGTLYSVPGLRHAIEMSAFQKDAPRVLILSALYGPLHPLSPIQDPWEYYKLVQTIPGEQAFTTTAETKCRL